MSAFLTLSGYRRMQVPADSVTAVLNLCLCHSLSYRSFMTDREGNATFLCSSGCARRLTSLCQAREIKITEVARGGIPMHLWQWRHRWGILAGAMLGITLLILSRLFVWEVEVYGNEALTRTQVVEALEECGFGVGSYIPGVDVPALENRVLIQSENIGWISVNLKGTVAKVQVVERRQAPPAESAAPANLVAAVDGQIELIELYRGNPVVGIGQGVRRGELLVSGIYDSPNGFRYTRAAGKVLARTERHLRIEIPLSYEEKVYEKGGCDEIYLNFFDFSLKIFKSTGNWDSSCDIIKMDNGISLPGGRILPLGWTVTKRLPYTVQTFHRTHEEATVLAYRQLAWELASLTEDAELLDKRIVATLAEDRVILDCTVKCIENIAVQAELEITQ